MTDLDLEYWWVESGWHTQIHPDVTVTLIPRHVQDAWDYQQAKIDKLEAKLMLALAQHRDDLSYLNTEASTLLQDFDRK